MKVLVALALAVSAAFLLAACGGRSSSISGSSSPAAGGPKKATAPDAPAGSKVTSCGGDLVGGVQLRATAVDCRTARAIYRRWDRSRACALGKAASRGSCSVGDLRCQAVRTDGGASVSCARPGADVSFLATPRP